LAPIQFGAGVKGNFIDGIKTGTPNVTTRIGVEGMNGNLDWNGFIADSDQDFVDKAVQLYTDKAVWEEARNQGVLLLNQRYAACLFSADFLVWIRESLLNLQKNRQFNFVGQLLSHHSLQSTKYMSLWIEEKNK